MPGGKNSEIGVESSINLQSGYGRKSHDKSVLHILYSCATCPGRSRMTGQGDQGSLVSIKNKCIVSVLR